MWEYYAWPHTSKPWVFVRFCLAVYFIRVRYFYALGALIAYILWEYSYIARKRRALRDQERAERLWRGILQAIEEDGILGEDEDRK